MRKPTQNEMLVQEAYDMLANEAPGSPLLSLVEEVKGRGYVRFTDEFYAQQFSKTRKRVPYEKACDAFWDLVYDEIIAKPSNRRL